MKPAVRDRRYLNLSALPVGISPRLTLRAASLPRRYNSGMARKRDMKGRRRIARTGVAIMGDIGILTTQELAEFIDRVEPVGSLDEALAFVGRDPEIFGDRLP